MAAGNGGGSADLTATGVTLPRRAPARGRNQLGQTMGAKGAQTRQRLLQATETLLATTRLRDLSVAQIVRQASTSAATFYVYFKDVPAAVLAILNEAIQNPPELIALVTRPWEGAQARPLAEAFIEAYVGHWHAHAAAFRARNLASDEGDRRFQELRVNAAAPLLMAMAARIGDRQMAGALPADLPATTLASALLAMIERISILPQPGGRIVTQAALMHVAAFFAVLLLGEGWWEEGRNDPAAAEAGHTEEAWPLPPSPLNLSGQTIGAKGARTRQRLIDATRELLQTRPLLGLSVADVTKLAETSTATFYLYFQDVTEAVLAATSQASQSTPDLLQILDSDWDVGDAGAKALAFCASYIRRWQENAGLFRARNLAADEGDERFVWARAEGVRELIVRLEGWIAEVQARGKLPGDLDPVAASGGFVAMIERLAAVANARIGGGAPEPMTRAAAFFLSVLMTGVPKVAS